MSAGTRKRPHYPHQLSWEWWEAGAPGGSSCNSVKDPWVLVTSWVVPGEE